jgi:hypothetical protein
MDGSSDWAAGWTTEESEFDSRYRSEICLFCSVQTGCGVHLPPDQGVLEGCRVMKLTSYLHLVLMLRNEWICTSIPPHAFMACTGIPSLQSYLKTKPY